MTKSTANKPKNVHNGITKNHQIQKWQKRENIGQIKNK